jgi:Sulfotransferase family
MFLKTLTAKRPLNQPTADLLSHIADHVDRSGPIRSPLLLISQISRSGGTWVSQLFDHHPQVFAHPLELRFGKSLKWDWPDVSALGGAEEVWRALRYAKAEERFGAGTYHKGNDQTYPILLSVELQHALFLRLAQKRATACERDWFDLYFTSFFSAWLDYQRRYGLKKYVVAFTSMLALSSASMTEFRRVYPDGWLLSIIREPVGWYASIKQRSSVGKELKSTQSHYGGPEGAQAAYMQNIQAIQRNRELFGDQFILIDYKALVADSESVMKTVAARIGLDWHPCLTRQTFNGMVISPNTAFDGEADRAKILTEADLARITDGPMMAGYLAARPQ